MHIHILKLKAIDDNPTIPEANGCVVTSLLYVLFTPWIFIALKWFSCCVCVMKSRPFLMDACINRSVYVRVINRLCCQCKCLLKQYLSNHLLRTHLGDLPAALHYNKSISHGRK